MQAPVAQPTSAPARNLPDADSSPTRAYQPSSRAECRCPEPIPRSADADYHLYKAKRSRGTPGIQPLAPGALSEAVALGLFTLTPVAVARLVSLAPLTGSRACHRAFDAQADETHPSSADRAFPRLLYPQLCVPYQLPIIVLSVV